MNKKEDMKRNIILILIAVIAYWSINHVDIIGRLLGIVINVLFPFILGGVIAFILNIPMTKIEKKLSKHIKNKKIPLRIISIVLSLIILISVIIFVAFLLIPELIQNIEVLIDNVPLLVEKGQNWIIDLLDRYPSIQVKIQDVFSQSSDFNGIITKVLNFIVNGSIGFISNFVSGVVSFSTAIIFSIYILSQKEYLQNGCKKLMRAYLKKEHVDKITKISILSNKTFSNFISGQCFEAVILSVIFFIILSILRFPYSLLISVLTAITALIPIFGAMIAMVIGAILIAITDPIQAIIFIAIFLIIQQIEGNFIYPKVVGKSVGLSPMWTLMAISVGGSLFGIVGMLIGLPLASIIYALIRIDVNQRLEKRKNYLK